MDPRTAQALIRFGLGRRGEEPLPADPAAWLNDQLRRPDPARIDPRPSTATGLAALRFDRETKPPPEERRVRPLFQAESAAELENALTTTAPFRERLVWFWTNHFTVSVRGGTSAVAGAFVEEAIRPNVTGRFETMLMAVMHHPAMLIYLNNAQSVGPDSPAGERTHRGLNENLARECMELHTVSPAAGYTQADVTSFAKVLTGWSIDLREGPPGFRFRPAAHEPGEQIVMGHRFPPGEEGGMAVLHFLANHPSTHRFLATKLARHFVADDPPPDAVRHIEGVLARHARRSRCRGGVADHAGCRLAARSEAARAAGLRGCLPACAGPAAGQTCRHEPAGHHRQPGPAVLELAATEWLGRPRQRLGLTGGDDAPHRLGLWCVRPGRRTARRPRRCGPRRGHARPAAHRRHAASGAPRRLPPRRDDPPADRPRIPEALTMTIVPTAIAGEGRAHPVKADEGPELTVMAGEGPPSTTSTAAPRKVVDADLRRHDVKGAVRASLGAAPRIALTRRSALLGLTAAVTLGRASLAVAAAPGDKRCVVVILRGALDGMAAVVPYGDPGLVSLRAELVPAGPGQANGLLDLGGFYGLHPSLANLHTMFQAGELLPIHAVVGPTRVRSHFEAQDCLESGADHRMTSGWLNRAVVALPGAAHGRPEGDALAIGVSVPLLLRGPATVGSWAPHGVLTPPPDLYTQIAALSSTDHIIGPAVAEGLKERGFTTAVMASSDDPSQPAKERYAFPALARAAGEMLRAAGRPACRRAGDRRLGHPSGASVAPRWGAEAT